MSVTVQRSFLAHIPQHWSMVKRSRVGSGLSFYRAHIGMIRRVHGLLWAPGQVRVLQAEAYEWRQVCYHPTLTVDPEQVSPVDPSGQACPTSSITHSIIIEWSHEASPALVLSQSVSFKPIYSFLLYENFTIVQ